MRLRWMQYLTPQQLRPLAFKQSFFAKDIQGDINIGEFNAIHVLRFGLY